MSQVFGVKKEMVLSYIERDQVDEKFKQALKTDKHIIVYGSSKQGKSALRRKHIAEEDEVLVQCGPNHDIQSIYGSILRQMKIQIESSMSDKLLTHDDVDAKGKFKVNIPFIGGIDAELGSKVGTSREQVKNYRSFDINLDVAQDVGEVLLAIKFSKLIILENFHYLEDEIQKRLAFDLRTFQDMGIRVVILGIWRERNRLNQFNGDLIDRITEVPVEPWEDVDFDKVINKGASLLNVELTEQIILKIKECSFGNIGIVQEICKELFTASGITESSSTLQIIDDESLLDKAIKIKVEDYTSRHQRALESIADASRSYEGGLFLPYYIVKIIILSEIQELKSGIKRQTLHTRIREIHYQPERVRAGDMTNLLHGLSNLQGKKSIVPPLFDYDRSDKRMKVIDSSLLFFLRFSDRSELLEEIPNPLESDIPDLLS